MSYCLSLDPPALLMLAGSTKLEGFCTINCISHTSTMLSHQSSSGCALLYSYDSSGAVAVLWEPAYVTALYSGSFLQGCDLALLASPALLQDLAFLLKKDWPVFQTISLIFLVHIVYPYTVYPYIYPYNLRFQHRFVTHGVKPFYFFILLQNLPELPDPGDTSWDLKLLPLPHLIVKHH